MNRAALERGQRRYRQQQQRAAVRRVRQFEAWMRSGYRADRLPPEGLPSSHDYKIAKAAR